MKLSAEEWAEIDRIKAKKLGSECDTFEDLNYCLKLLEKIRPKSRERFTYEMRDCETCDGVGEVGAVISMTNDVCDIDTCKACGGLGQVRVKVKSKAHNA